ncbi:MAG TPA: glycoside hydrolase family 3 N-terminal domain-containing protein, partial [Clostridiales bacterium]|nr:glycoside hydrolase family 3 N-terminal domain-containing protein [Clostridiales bacterium]
MKPLNLADLTIEQKIGQMLLCRRPLNDEDKEYILELIRNRSLGGIHGMFPELLETADYPLLICENMESGFPKGEAELTCPLAIGATGSEEYAYEFGRISAIEAKAKGYNVVFGPIFDIALNPAAFCGGSLRFGGNKELVSRLGAAAVRGYQDQGMIVTAKHYPGFGESAIDSHLEMVYLKCDKKLLLERELEPYRYAIEHADLSGVMVGHITVPKIDDKYPASLSPKITNILREIGFDGLTMTDSLAMLGITNYYGLEECHALAMTAVDMVMASYRVPAKMAYEFMLNAYRKGRVTEEQIDEAVRRVIAAQNKTLKKPETTKLTHKEMNLAKEISRDSITALLDGVDSTAIPTDGRHLFIL